MRRRKVAHCIWSFFSSSFITLFRLSKSRIRVVVDSTLLCVYILYGNQHFHCRHISDGFDAPFIWFVAVVWKMRGASNAMMTATTQMMQIQMKPEEKIHTFSRCTTALSLSLSKGVFLSKNLFSLHSSISVSFFSSCYLLLHCFSFFFFHYFYLFERKRNEKKKNISS